MTTDEQTTPKKRGAKSPMSQGHKDALALGRTEGAAVRAYLGALREHQPKRGRKRTVESVESRLTDVNALLDKGVEPMDELRLIQERMDLTVERDQMINKVGSPADFEDDFVAVARSYSERLGISYQAWREIGVAASVLKRAGLTRASV